MRCPAAGWAERGRAPGPRVFTGPQAPPDPLPITLQSLWQCDGRQRKPPPRPCCFSTAPGAAGSRRTPAAAGGADGRCSWAASGCSWWPSGKRQRLKARCVTTFSCPNLQGAGQRGGTQEPKMHGARKPGLRPSPGVQVRTEPRGGVRLFPKPASTPGPGARTCVPEMGPRGQAAGDAPSCQEMEGDPLLPASYPLVGQQELQVTLAPVGVRFRPRLQLVPLVVPAVQVLCAQRQGVKECSHWEWRRKMLHCISTLSDFK